MQPTGFPSEGNWPPLMCQKVMATREGKTTNKLFSPGSACVRLVQSGLQIWCCTLAFSPFNPWEGRSWKLLTTLDQCRFQVSKLLTVRCSLLLAFPGSESYSVPWFTLNNSAVMSAHWPWGMLIRCPDSQQLQIDFRPSFQAHVTKESGAAWAEFSTFYQGCLFVLKADGWCCSH